MANRRASVWVYKKVEGKWKYVKPEYGRNGKIKPDPDGTYYVRWYEGKKAVWRRCSSPADAESACKQQEAYLNAKVARTDSGATGSYTTSANGLRHAMELANLFRQSF